MVEKSYGIVCDPESCKHWLAMEQQQVVTGSRDAKTMHFRSYQWRDGGANMVRCSMEGTTSS